MISVGLLVSCVGLGVQHAGFEDGGVGGEDGL